MKDIRQQWKALAAARKITPKDVAALCVYRALLKTPDVDTLRTAITQGYGKEGAIHRLLKSFKPITNQVKLSNGAEPYGCLMTSLRLAKYSEVYSWLDEEDKVLLQNLATEISRMKIE